MNSLLHFKIFSILVFVGFLSCTNTNSIETSNDQIADSTVQLVKTICSSCHEFVPPEMLDRKTWIESVIPIMAPKMGIYEVDGVKLLTESNDPFAPKGIYPDKPMITMAQYRQILEYFRVMAPEQLPLQDRKKQIGPQTARFTASWPNLPPTEPALTTFVHILPKEQKIVAGVGGQYNRLGYFNKDLSPIWVTALPSPPSWVDFSAGNQWILSCIGTVMPSNKKEGMILRLNVPALGQPRPPTELIKNLGRPVQVNMTDMDGNGSKDYLISSFGHLAGDLGWRSAANVANPNLLKDAPGVIHTEVVDWDGDGKKDVISLFTQGREGIYLYKNMGNGKYNETRLIGFLPVNGSSTFRLADMNADGKLDIIYTSGDNADYSVVLKHFHGVYVYLNQGKNEFKQAYFYPIHGCFSLAVKDFDLDGDLDIFTLSFFPDFLSQHNEAVVYLENSGNLDFTPFSVPGFDKGRWITCDAGDLDGDGDDDLVLGNFAMGPESFMPKDLPGQFGLQPIFMLLTNTTK